jgi:DNA-binding NarL/FixJ family response regulator
VDDASGFRFLLVTALKMDGRFQVIGEGADGTEAISLARELDPDVLVLDLFMPQMDGLAVLPVVSEYCPATRVVLMSAFGNPTLGEAALSLGASSFVEKGGPIDLLIDAVLKAAASK